MMSKGITVCQWGSRIINLMKSESPEKLCGKVTCNEFTKPNSLDRTCPITTKSLQSQSFQA